MTSKQRVGPTLVLLGKLDKHLSSKDVFLSPPALADDPDFNDEAWQVRTHRPFQQRSTVTLHFRNFVNPKEIEVPDEDYEPRVWPKELRMEACWQPGLSYINNPSQMSSMYTMVGRSSLVVLYDNCLSRGK